MKKDSKRVIHSLEEFDEEYPIQTEPTYESFFDGKKLAETDIKKRKKTTGKKIPVKCK